MYAFVQNTNTTINNIRAYFTQKPAYKKPLTNLLTTLHRSFTVTIPFQDSLKQFHVTNTKVDMQR